MGRSKKPVQGSGGGGGGGAKAMCFWCDQEFAEEEKLIQHQLAKHFRCPQCKSGSAGKCINLECLIIHFRKLHRSELLTVPNAKEGRTEPTSSQHIYGMAGVPEEVLLEWNLDTMPEKIEPPEPTPMGVGGIITPRDQMVATQAVQQQQFTQQQQAPAPSFAAPTAEGNKNEELAGKSLAEQLAEWMNAKKEAEAPPPEPAPPVMQPPSQYQSNDRGNGFSRPERGTSAPAPFAPFGGPNNFGGFSLGSTGRGGSASGQVDAAAAASTIAAFADTAKLAAMSANAPASSKPPDAAFSFIQPQFAAAPAAAPGIKFKRSRSGSRDRDRGRDRRRSRSRRGGRSRSRSRGRGNRDRPREAQPSWRPGQSDKGGGKGGGGGGKDGGKGGGELEARTLTIIEGQIRSRLQLKGEMEKFGRVETVYMGNRHDPTAEPPLVRFENAASADVALAAINSGQVFFDGMPVKAEMKKGGRRPMQRDIEREVDNKLHITSRDFARDDRRRPDRWGS